VNLDRGPASFYGDLLSVDPIDPGQRVPLVEGSLELSNRSRLAFQLRLHSSVRKVSHEPTHLEGAREVPDELAEVHSLHPAGEPEPYSDESHIRAPPDLK
jgi:hypothetical protein